MTEEAPAPPADLPTCLINPATGRAVRSDSRVGMTLLRAQGILPPRTKPRSGGGRKRKAAPAPGPRKGKMRFTELTEEEAQAVIEEEIAANAVPDVDDMGPFRPRKADFVPRQRKRPMQGFRQAKSRDILTRAEALAKLNGFA